MEFSEQYLTYEEYRSLGGTLDLTPFNLLEFEARKKIDLRTHDRLKKINSKNIPQEIKLCAFHLIEKTKDYEETTSNINGNIESENTDGYSIKYITADKIKELVKSKDDELQDIMLSDLYGVVINGEHIIYNGGV